MQMLLDVMSFHVHIKIAITDLGIKLIYIAIKLHAFVYHEDAFAETSEYTCKHRLDYCTCIFSLLETYRPSNKKQDIWAEVLFNLLTGTKVCLARARPGTKGGYSSSCVELFREREKERERERESAPVGRVCRGKTIRTC